MNTIPIKHSKCAVVIPYYTSNLKAIERYCLEGTLKVLRDNHDIYFMRPLDLEDDQYTRDFLSYVVSRNSMLSVETYCRFLLEPDFYNYFLLYDRVLIVQVDAILLRDDILAWVEKDFDYIGAPWFNRLVFRPEFYRSINSNAGDRLDVGNGGLCMLNPRSFLHLQRKYREIFKSFYKYTGPNAGQEALYSFLCREDQFFKLSSRSEACLFSLELEARRQILEQKVLPMGFHAVYKYDLDLWMEIFPNSPTPND